MDAALTRAAELIRDARGLLITAGAGMGVDSGLPDFRGPEGFWQAYPALGQARLPFEEIADPENFQRQPTLAWGFYGHRLALYRATVPHAGFDILRRIGERLPHGLAVFTSNVDGQFQKAGFDPARIVECHGSIHHLQCLTPCAPDIWSADGFSPEVDMDQCRLLSPLPRCSRCGAPARPNILMFRDGGWVARRTEAQWERLDAWIAGMRREDFVVVELGAGAVIPSVRRYGEEQGAALIRINPRDYSVADARHVGLAMGAAEALDALARRLASDGFLPV